MIVEPKTTDAAPAARLELWGGHECTVNRVRDEWFDQTLRSGHQLRQDDLSLFAGLGMSRLRYPVLWERIAPRSAEEHDFTWSDERLSEIRRLGMKPVATLCHHGSGPHYTSLLDDGFAPGLALHAAAVAERYPWVDDYTPVNEVLTTARFSALYGFWYPHKQDEGIFWRALLNEVDATRLSMHAIRRINAAARLIQTDDLGFCHATPPLQAEADFQNERRWIGWDLLCGKVVPGHALWARIAQFGFEDRLLVIADDPCAPDVIGINHYLSSERLLDHRVELHATRALADRELGKCDGVVHVDVDAVRSVPDQVIGLSRLIEQVWDRYQIPVAVTECHNGSTREEQARWFIDAWEAVGALRDRGVDVQALTAWSLLGAYDWNRMVTTADGHYEPGVFDVRSGRPQPTMMAGVLQALADGRRPSGPGLDVPGWWHEERRCMSAGAGPLFEVRQGPSSHLKPQPLAILRDDGVLTSLAVEACERRGLHYVLIDDRASTSIRAVRPWAVLDTVGVIPATSGTPGRTQEFVKLCREMAITAAFIRGDENEGEHEAGDMLSIITGPVFTADDEGCVEVRLLEQLDGAGSVTADGRAAWSGVYGPALIDGVLDLLLDRVTGKVYFEVEQGLSVADMASALAHAAGHEPAKVVENPKRVARKEPAPISYLPSLGSVLERFVGDRRSRRQPTYDVDGDREATGEWLVQAAE